MFDKVFYHGLKRLSYTKCLFTNEENICALDTINVNKLQIDDDHTPPNNPSSTTKSLQTHITNAQNPTPVPGNRNIEIQLKDQILMKQIQINPLLVS